MLRSLIFLFILVIAIKIPAQNHEGNYYLLDSLNLNKLTGDDKRTLDSLLKKYHATNSDSLKIDALKGLGNLYDFEVSWAYTRKLNAEASRLLKKGSRSAGKKYLNKRLGDALYNMHYYFSMTNNEDSSLIYLKRCIEPYRIAEDQEGLASAYQGLGVISVRSGKSKEGLDYYQKSLLLHEKTNSKSGIAALYINMANVYRDINEFDKALKYALEALKINEAENFEDHLPDNWNQLGIIYKYKKDTASAIKAFQTSLKISKKLNFRYGIAGASLNLALIEQNRNNYSKALEGYLESLEHFKAAQSKNGVAHTLNSIGIVYQLMGDYARALDYTKQAHQMNLELGYPESILNSSQTLGHIYEKLGKYKEAVEYQKQYYHLKDSLQNSEVQKSILKKQLEYENEKHVGNLKKEQHEKMLIAQQEKKRQNIILVFTLLVLVIVGFFLVFLFNRFKLIKKQKHIIEEKSLLLEEKNKEVKDSITYAKRLQEAILPSTQDLKHYIPGAFIFYQPKDIVAGDFFWMHVIKENNILFGVADSTGHGVPGALVSVVCSNALNRSVNEFALTDPGKILDKTRELVSETFEKNNRDVKDGMDISLIQILFHENKSATIRWAGANNPLWFFRGNEFVEIKPNKQPVGKIESPAPFNTHEFTLGEGDIIYLFTDGYADQFGGTDGKKLKYKPFAKLLDGCRTMLPEQQRDQLEKELNQWKGSLEQVDDICVAGIKL